MSPTSERPPANVCVFYVAGDSAAAERTKRHLQAHAPHIHLEIVDGGVELLARIQGLPGEPCACDVVLLDSRRAGEDMPRLIERIREQRGPDLPVVLRMDPAEDAVFGPALRAGAIDPVARHPSDLYALPFVLSNAHRRALLARENASLRESAWRLQVIIETEPECVKVVAPNGGLVEMNGAGLRMLEAGSLAEAQQRGLIDYLLPEHRESFVALHRRVMAGETGTLEFEVVGLKGTRRWLETHAAPLRGPGEETVALLGITRDVTERKRGETRLRESDERFRQIAENITEVFWITDPAKRQMIYISPAYETIWGRSCASVYENPGSFVDAIHPEDRERVRARMARQASGEYDEVFRILRPDGTLRFIHDRAFPVRSPEGEVVRVVGSAQDITSLKEAEQALRETEARYRSLFESAPDGFLVGDSQGRCVDANPSCLEMLGYSRDELIGMESSEFLAAREHSRVESALSEINQGFEHRQEWLFRRKDGSVFTADVKATVMADGRILALVRDATERKRMEEQLRQSQKMEAVGRLAGGIAHDFNNVLGVVIGYGETLLGDLPPGDPNRRRVGEIVRAAERGAGLTRQLLAFSRKQVLEPRILEPSAVVTDMRRLLHPLIGEHIELVLQAEARGRVKVDPGQLEQVVMNLVVNARDAMPAGGTLRIETADLELDQGYAQRRGVALRPGRYVMLAVADTGVGMNAATQAQVFEPFYTTKAEGRGTGLGLATAYGIVKQSDGYIWMDSEVGKGTVFRVYLPSVEEAVTPERARPRAAARPATETLLVVEDEPAARELVAEVLRNQGYRVLLAADGLEGVEIATSAREPIHLLLTDVVLPKLGGRAAADRIRGINPGIKILYMSGYTDKEVSRHGVLEPGIELLQKPFTPDDLVRRVGEVLDEAQS